MLNHPVITGGPMLRYIFLSIFALLLLTACGDRPTEQTREEETAAGTSSGTEKTMRQETVTNKPSTDPEQKRSIPDGSLVRGVHLVI
jgi:ABC-type enterochelin transport system substrate-binding protein